MTCTDILYLLLCILVIQYYTILGCWMFAYRYDLVSTRGEQEAKRRMVRSVGATMFLWGVEYFLCLPPLLYTDDIMHPSYKIYFLSAMVLSVPMLYVVIRSILQKWEGTIRGACILGSLFLIVDIWYLVSDWDSMLQVNVAKVMCLVCVIGFIVMYARDYRNYLDRLRSEYSETNNRDIAWACWCFVGLAVQMVVYLLYVTYWSIILDFIYVCLSVVNAAFICYFTREHKVMDNDIVAEDIDEAVGTTQRDIANGDKSEGKAFYGIIEQKLESLCEKNQLFLEPDLTRESLCLRLSVGRTYLSLYLHSRGLTFYQYINTLRVEYAIKLMEQNPDMSIRKISELSGFRSQTTFRKVFQELMGCLPSELMSKKDR